MLARSPSPKPPLEAQMGDRLEPVTSYLEPKLGTRHIIPPWMPRAPGTGPLHTLVSHCPGDPGLGSSPGGAGPSVYHGSQPPSRLGHSLGLMGALEYL